jgi:hypothetical protein
MNDLFGTSAATRAASLFSRSDPTPDEELPGVHAMTLRLPLRMAATVIAMADGAGLSRNEMAQLVIQAGIDAIYAATPEPLREDLESSVSEVLETLIN